MINKNRKEASDIIFDSDKNKQRFTSLSMFKFIDNYEEKEEANKLFESVKENI